jgi:hypothetical protein
MSNCLARCVRTVLAFDAGDVGDLLDIQKSGHAGQEALSEGRVATNDVGVFALLDVLDEERGVVLGKALRIKKKLGLT